jgi:hypothetical protein
MSIAESARISAPRARIPPAIFAKLAGVLAKQVLGGIGVDEGVHRLWRTRRLADAVQTIVRVDLDENQTRILAVPEGFDLDDYGRFRHGSGA